VIPLPARVSLLSGIPVTTANSDLQAIAFQRCLYHRPTRILDSALKPIFMPRDAPEAHEVCYENRVQRADGFARSGSFLLECDGIAETLQAMNQVSSQVMFVEFVEVEIP